MGHPRSQGATAGKQPGAGPAVEGVGGRQVGAGLVLRTSGREDRGPEAGAPTPGSREPASPNRIVGSPCLRSQFGVSPLAASLSTCSWGPTTRPSPDVFPGAGCVFTSHQPASPNSTVTSLWAQVSAVDLLSVDGGLVSQKPGARVHVPEPHSLVWIISASVLE